MKSMRRVASRRLTPVTGLPRLDVSADGNGSLRVPFRRTANARLALFSDRAAARQTAGGAVVKRQASLTWTPAMLLTPSVKAIRAPSASSERS